MELIDAKREGDTLTVFLKGHIDSSNAAALEQEIDQARQEHPARDLVLDAQDLVYISSAGLRVLLRLRKTYPALKVINVSSEVYEILDMTGFTEMLDVTKAYRVISVEGCEVIGQGANGKVYRIDPDTIAKIGPMLGLMGTLIPMGPALVGLSTGDIASMAYNMQVAFATTVIGLFSAAIGFVVLQCKQRWYARDLAALEFVASLRTPNTPAA